MAIEDREARATREFRGHTLHFCSETCASRFDLAPKKYWKPPGREGRAAHEHRSAEVAQHDHRGHMGHHATMVTDFRRRFWVSLLLTVPILLLSHPIQRLLGLEEVLYFPEAGYLQFLLATLIYVYGGWPFLKGFGKEMGELQPGMMTLITMAITMAYGYSGVVTLGVPGEVLFWELATLIDVMLLGHWIEMRSVLGASRALEKLVTLLPSEAHRVEDGGATREVPISQLTPGDRVLVKPGEKIPIDGVVVEGRTTVNEAMLTGESSPVERDSGDAVIGGAVNGEGAIVVEVRRTGAETYLFQVIELVRRAQEARSRTQDLANRAALWLTIVAVSVGTATLVGWLVAGVEFNFALARMVTVMVIACPHALGLAIPLVVSVSTSLAAGQGLLIRDRTAFERARDIQAVVFDKTGTLTEGRFGVSDVIPLGTLPEEEVLRLAAGVESRSEHPIAAGIVQAAIEQGLVVPAPTDFSAIPGQGATGTVDGKAIKVVSPGYLAAHSFSVEDARVGRAATQGKTVVYVLIENQVEGAIAVADLIRDESRAALLRLKEMGIQTMMLTGDSSAVAAWVAGKLGLDDYFAQVLPHEKADRIRGVKARGLVVAMVGDGVNDAPALVEADVGIAIGAGTDVAIESADIVLVRNDPQDVATVIHLSRATYAKMVQNLGWATGYNVVAIPLAAGVLAWLGVLLSPALGAAFMAVSTVVVAANAQLLSREVQGRRRSASQLTG